MAANLNLSIDQGSTYELVLTVYQPDGSAMDLTGYAVRGQIRPTVASDTVAAEFTGSVLDPATDGKLKVALTEEQTTALDLAQYVYDVEIYATGYVKRVIQGKVAVSFEVTRV